MKKIIVFALTICLIISALSMNAFADEKAVQVIRGKQITGLSELGMAPEVRFTCPTATKNGNTYTNKWSNYFITCTGGRSGFDYFDTADKDSKYDLALVFPDGSRLAIYYTTLSRDIGVIANNFAKSTGSGNGTVEDKVFAGNVFKHILVSEPDPDGMNYHEYFIRQVEADKLMVVDAYYANITDGAFQSMLTMAPLAVQ